jgi:hypothetical protein
VLSTNAHGPRVRAEHPVFPAPSDFSRDIFLAQLGRYLRRGNAEVCLEQKRAIPRPSSPAKAGDPVSTPGMGIDLEVKVHP